MSGRDDRIIEDNMKAGAQGKPVKGGTFWGGPYDERENQLAEDSHRRGMEIEIEEQVRRKDNP